MAKRLLRHEEFLARAFVGVLLIDRDNMSLTTSPFITRYKNPMVIVNDLADFTEHIWKVKLSTIVISTLIDNNNNNESKLFTNTTTNINYY